jgi:tRNA G18 (ribose-2'-O)-methylase SpoU
VSRGFFAIGICHNRTPANLGTLWRSAQMYDAAFIFTVGARYRQQASDTPKTPRHKPLFHFADLADLIDHLPHSTPLVGIELDPRATMLGEFVHPERACYLLGAEDHGLTVEQRDACHQLVQIEGPKPQSLNVSVAGSLVMHHRWTTSRRMAVTQ